MEDPNTTAAPSAVDPTSTPAAAPAVEVQQPASTPATPVEAVPAGVDRTDKASLRRAEREAGRRKLTEKLDREAKSLGYANHAELLASVRAQKADASAKPADSATPAAPAAVEELPDEDKGVGRVAALQNHISTLEKQAARHQREMRLLRKEMEMRDECYKHGVRDVEFTVSLLAKQAAAGGADFNKDDFFKQLKKERAYLFGEAKVEERRASTTADDKPAPRPGATEKVPATRRAKDMTPAEFAAWKKKNVGIRHPIG
jgi:hypothetical protein